MLRALFVSACLLVPMTAHSACDAPRQRDFDFWIGEWEVVAPDDAPEPGKPLGRNRIERFATGCGLAEHWTGASGFNGRSLNAWDALHSTWRQFWVGSDGTVLQLAGGLQGRAMVMTGEMPAAGGGVQRQRITWTPLEDGRVRQHWETSDDAGKTWSTSFLGLYRRAAAP